MHSVANLERIVATLLLRRRCGVHSPGHQTAVLRKRRTPNGLAPGLNRMTNNYRMSMLAERSVGTETGLLEFHRLSRGVTPPLEFSTVRQRIPKRS